MAQLEERKTPKPTTRFFRRVVIDPELKECVDAILFSGAPDWPEVTAAQHRIRQKSTPESAYLHASEIRSYLEERAEKIGTEDRIYPLVGDLFLDAAEANLATMGPRFFEDHYTSMISAYRQGNEVTSAIEGSFFTIDLLLEKVEVIFQNRNDAGAGPTAEEQTKVGTSQFTEAGDPTDYRETIALFMQMTERALRDTIETLTTLDRSKVPAGLVDYVADMRPTVERIVKDWATFHLDPENEKLDCEAYLVKAHEIAEQAGHLPLTTHLKEELARFYKAEGHTCAEPWDEDQITHAYYDAGDFCHIQGNREREAGAFKLAYRRYTHAKRLFDSIRDRTAAAQALMERARSLIKEDRDPGGARQDLYTTVQLVLAHKMRLPRGKLPTPSDEQVVEWLHRKGYVIEARFYAKVVASDARSSYTLRHAKRPS
jgi:hypothetical protein